jgi:hypothetical protein
MTFESEMKLQELEHLRERVRWLEAELAVEPATPAWERQGYYTAYYATTGFLLGGLAACTSLLLNVIGSAATMQHPLKLIQVYLTFPMGEAALALDGGLALTIGCCLYIGTGMVYGIAFQLLLTRFFPTASLGTRLVAAALLGLAIWLVNFYGILSWLQPLLFGGRWILDEVPWWVAGATHLVFGLTMALVYPLGLYEPYSSQSEQT